MPTASPPDSSVDLGAVTLVYETFGDPGDPPLLLVQGLGVSLLGWHEDFCNLLAARGYYVIRYDNRDVGRSTHLHDAPRPDLAAGLAGDRSSASYTVSDLASDAAGLVGALDLEPVVVMGVSMGGMIAQTLAAEHPARVRGLVSVMSTPAPSIGPPTPAALAALLKQPASDRQGYIDDTVETWKVIGSPAYFDEAEVRDRAGRAYDRSFDPLGVARQLMAIWASGDRSAAVATIRVPTVVGHGLVDPLITPEGGRRTAALIPDAGLDLVEDMAHDLPRPLWDRFAGWVDQAAGRP